ncbi:MAG: hypothetical protein ACREBQ_11060, partial [Nitrososphaerales archaeon]
MAVKHSYSTQHQYEQLSFLDLKGTHEVERFADRIYMFEFKHYSLAGTIRSSPEQSASCIMNCLWAHQVISG